MHPVHDKQSSKVIFFILSPFLPFTVSANDLIHD